MNILYYTMDMPMEEFKTIFDKVVEYAGPTIAIPKDWQFLENCSDDQLHITMNNLRQMADSIQIVLNGKRDKRLQKIDKMNKILNKKKDAE